MPSTVLCRELELLSKIFNLAIDYGIAETNPCRKVRKLRLNNKRIRYLSDEEETRCLLISLGQCAHLRIMVNIAIGTGMRRGEQLNLRWEKVDFQRNVIHVPNSKTGRDYTVPMNQDVRNELLALRKLAAKEDYVFTNPKTGKSFTEIKRSFHTACRLAGIDNLRWHDLRHTFGSRLGDAGCAESTIAQLMLRWLIGTRMPPNTGSVLPLKLLELVVKPSATILPQTTSGQLGWPL